MFNVEKLLEVCFIITVMQKKKRQISEFAPNEKGRDDCFLTGHRLIF